MLSRKNVEIEYLRGIAVVMTLLSHIPTLLPFYSDSMMKVFSVFWPWTGVDLFFCISAYVVSQAYLEYFDKHRSEGHFGLAAACFWIRRAYRLIPTSWLWVLISLLASVAFNQSNAFGSWIENVRSFTAVATFSGNLANLYDSRLGPNGHYWSLALEEQFYFIFPLFLLCITSVRWRAISLFTVIALLFCLDRHPFGTPMSSFLNVFRLDAMLWGILLCLFTRTKLYSQIEPRSLSGNKLKSIAIMFFLFYMLGAIAGQLIIMPIAVGLIAVVALLIVWLASYQSGYIYCPAFMQKSMLWLGSRSYALYVIHLFSNHLSIEIWTRITTSRGVPLDSSYTAELVLTSVVSLVILSELNYRYVETPLRRKGIAVAQTLLSGSRTEQEVPQPQASVPTKVS